MPSTAKAFRQEIRFAPTSDGLRIAYAVSGRGYPLVRTTHWLTSIEYDNDTSVLGPWLRETSSRYTLYRYNARGYGLSEATDEPPSLESMITDLEAVVDAAKLDRFALWGPSGGSKPALVYASRHPDRVSHLVITSGMVRSNRKYYSAEDQERYQAMLKLIELGWGQNHDGFLQMMTTQLFPGASLEQMRSFNELQRRTTTPYRAAAMIRAMGGEDAEEALPAIRAQTLVLHSRGDVRVPLEEGRLIASKVPNARLVVLDSINHTPLEGEPAFTQAIEEIDRFLPRSQMHGLATGALETLTSREREILDLVARGMDNTKIAAWFNLSEKTVRNNVSRILEKLSVEHRGQAIIVAREAGLGQ